MDKGWIKFHRRILENHFLMNDEKAYIVFTKLLLLVGQSKGQWSGGRLQLAELMDMNPNTLYKVLKRLEGQQLITTNSNNRYTVYTICNWHKYQTSSNSQNKNEQLRGNSAVTTREHSNKNKNKNKNSIDKSIGALRFGNSGINEMFDFWEKQLGYKIDARVQQNRRACSNMLKKHGDEKLKQLVQGVVAAQQDQFAPRISDFAELQSKLSQLLVWGKSRAQKSVTL